MSAKPKLVTKTQESRLKAESKPITMQDFAELMEDLGSLPSKIALAVSGGPDSMALALCAKKWACAEKTRSFFAFIVDHGLRAESGKEARQVKTELRRLGIGAEILCWEHDPVIARLHATAREARYQLLIDACKKRDIKALLLGHQREDQAETILMRFAKGSGIDGLAGMPKKSMQGGVRILRPFLDVPRARLEATCKAFQVSFISDPSNGSEKFARGRLRRVMPLLAAEGFTTERLLDLGARAKEAKAALDYYTEALLRVAGKMERTGIIRFDLEQLRSAPKAVRERAFGVCLQIIGGGNYPPLRTSLTDLLDALCADKKMHARTLHGCLIDKGEKQAIIARELAAIRDKLPISSGETVIWDARWKMMLSCGSNLVIRPLGNPPHALLDKLAPQLRREVPQGRVRASLPALWRSGKLVLIPDFSETTSKNEVKAELLVLWPPFLGNKENVS